MKTLTKVACGMGLLSLLAAPTASLANTTTSDSFLANKQLAISVQLGGDGYRGYHGGYRGHGYRHWNEGYRPYYRGYRPACRTRCFTTDWGERRCKTRCGGPRYY